MDECDAREAFERLRKSLDEVVALLVGAGDQDWSERFDQAPREMAGHDAPRAHTPRERLRRDGKLQDVHLTRLNGHDVRPSRERSINAWLRRLRASLSDDATALRRDLA